MYYHYLLVHLLFFFFFFFNDTATTEIYTLSLHDALPILCSGQSCASRTGSVRGRLALAVTDRAYNLAYRRSQRSEEHTSELQSQSNLVCRLLLEKKKKQILTSSTLRRNIRHAMHLITGGH